MIVRTDDALASVAGEMACPPLTAHWDSSKITILDDSRNQPLCGGNKIRKLVRFLQGKDPKGLLAFGSRYSSLCLATAWWGARNGVPVRLLILDADETEVSRGDYPHLRLARELGADIVTVHPDRARERIDEEQDAAPTYTLVPGGAHCKEGLQAYEEWFSRVLSHHPELQERDWIALPFGTGTTALGIAAAVQAAGVGIRVIGVSVARDRAACLDHVTGLVDSRALDRLEIDDRFAGQYGVMSPHHRELRMSFFRGTGILPDPIYNVRVAELVETEGFRNGIIVNTGGQWNNLLADPTR